jgi:hypothetical protein
MNEALENTRHTWYSPECQALAMASFSQHPFTGSISTIVGVTGAVVQVRDPIQLENPT